MDANARAVSADERWGVLHPENLRRHYGAQMIAPEPSIAEVVHHFWHVQWDLSGGEVIPQRIIATPAITLTIERGNVPAPLVVTGVYRETWEREISGWGEVFAIRLRPAGLAVLTDLEPDSVANTTVALDAELDARAFHVLSEIAVGTSLSERVELATRAIERTLAEHPVTAAQRLANEVVGAIDEGRRLPDASTRTIQRALKSTLGHGPKWVAQWIRLQEVARRLFVDPGVSAAEVAISLGYVDQAHMVNDFRRAVGVTPAAYVRSMRGLIAGAEDG